MSGAPAVHVQRVVFLPGVMGSALGHRTLADAPRECRAYLAGAPSAAFGPSSVTTTAGLASFLVAGHLCADAHTMWGRAGMLYTARDGDVWHSLLADTDGIDDPRGAFVLPDGDGLTRIELPAGRAFAPYDSLVQRLRATATIDLHVHAYDWRLSNRVNARLLAEAIVNHPRWRFSVPPRPEERITIVAHSLGGLIARCYLESKQLRGAPRVRQLITVGTPHDGAPEMFTHLLGITQPLDRLHPVVANIQQALGGSTPGHLLRPELQVKLARKLTSLIEMLPVYDFVRVGRTKDSWRRTLENLDLPDHGKSALQVVDEFRAELIASRDLPHWLDCQGLVYTFVGATGVSTVGGFNRQNWLPESDVDGDGTVPLRSALAGSSAEPWRGWRLSRYRVIRRPVAGRGELANPEGLDHQDLMQVQTVRSLVLDKVLRSNPESSARVAGAGLVLADLHRLGEANAIRAHPKGRRAQVVAIATVHLAEPSREPPLRFEVGPCGRSGMCVQGVRGITGELHRWGADGMVFHQLAWLLPTEPSASILNRGGVLVLPPDPCSGRLQLAAWNTRDMDADRLRRNHHHAERQLLAWIARQDEPWRRRISSVDLSVSKSPCTQCAADLHSTLVGDQMNVNAAFKGPIMWPARASISWGIHYRSANADMTTTTDALEQLKAAGWTIEKHLHNDERRQFHRKSPLHHKSVP